MNLTTPNCEGAHEALEDLFKNCKRGKDRHFRAAERKLRYHIFCGVPAIVINLFVASVLVKLQSNATAGHDFFPSSTFSVATIILAFVGASLGSVQTFFNFHKTAEGHRSVANRYLNISSDCSHLLLRHRDTPLTAKALWDEVAKFKARYERVNSDAEAFPTNSADHQKSLVKKAKDSIPSSEGSISP